MKNCWTYPTAAILLTAYSAVGAGFTVEQFLPKPGGLPKSVVRAVIQTHDGYLWCGTPEGLARFDGVDFTVFDENNTPGLKSRNIVSLFEDSQSNLWVGTENAGVALVKEGKVVNLDVGQMRAACEDTNGAVWLYTDGGQLCRYRDNKVDVWSVGTRRLSTCRALALDETGLLWVGTDWSLTALGPVSATASAGLPVAQEIPPNQLHRLDLLLTSKRGGYWRFADMRIQKWKGSHCESDWPYPSSTSVPVAACEDLDGNLIVGTYGAGVFWFDVGGHFDRIASEEGLSHNFVLAVTVDREGSLWVGTTGGGLNRVKRQMFNVLEKTPSWTTRGKTVQSVCEDKSGGLWIGYNGERVDYWNGTSAQEFTDFVNYQYIKCVFATANGRIFAGAQGPRGQRLFKFEKPGFRPIFGDTVATPDVSAFYQDRKGTLWVGTKAGLAVLDDHGLKFLNNAPSRLDVRAITDDADGSLWIGTDTNGVARLSAGRFTSFTRTNGLPSDEIRSLYMDSDSVLWASTSSGLTRYANSKWTTFSKKEGLLSDSLGYLVEDGQGYLWMGSNVGLLRVKKKDLNDFAEGKGTNILCRPYGELEGLPADECTFGSQPAAIRAHDGKMWFPTIKGLAYLNPDQIKINSNPPPVLIESVAIDGKMQNANALKALPLQKVTVPAGKEAIDIKFTSLNLAAPEKGHFKFRLKGHEKEWQKSPWNIRTAHYSRVPPGDYTFEVSACNEDGVWNEKGSVLQLSVLPPFWSTWWFRTIAIGFLVGVIVGSVHYVSTQRLQRQVAALRQQEALEKERSRIARDLHDQLGANLTQVALLGELAESDKDSPQEIEAHARQISQTARETTHSLDEIVWTVNPSNDTLDGLVNYVCKYAQEYLAVAGLKYRLDVPTQLPNTPISPELRHNIFLASKEAITNIVRHAHATSASVRLRLDSGSFTLEIEDDGKGLNDSDTNKGRNGLQNMRKRLADVGGEFSISPGIDGGTKVRLTAPLGKDIGGNTKKA